MPSYTVRFFWPIRYYDPSSKLEITYDPMSSYMVPENNTGFTTEDFTSSYMFNIRASYIPEAPSNERSLKLYMRERRFGDDVIDKLNSQDHEGPTIILVKTSTTTTSRWSYATSTGRSSVYTSSRNDNDSEKAPLSPGAIAGIAVGIGLACILFMIVCCRQIRETSSAEQRRIDAIISTEEQKRINREAMELMQQQNVQREVDGVDGMGVATGDRPPAYTEQPPQYTPRGG